MASNSSSDALFDVEKVDILVVGQTGHGKSTLINKLLGIQAPVTYGPQSTRHKPIESYQVQIGNTTLTVHDTRGLGDRNYSVDQILQKLKSERKSYDLVLICQRLFDKVDETTQRILNQLAENLGNDLFEKSIYVFTFGDEYKSRCKVYESKHLYVDKDKLNDDLEKEMIVQKEGMKKEFDDILKSAGISRHVVTKIPACIVSGKKYKLPTTQDWMPDLWNLCVNRCKGDAKPFMNSWKEVIILKYGITAGYGAALGLVSGAKLAGVEGALVGAVAGAVLAAGSMFIENEKAKLREKQKKQ